MGIFGDSKGKKSSKKQRKPKLVVKTRKELRKEKRQRKKHNRAEYYAKKNQLPGKSILNPNHDKPSVKSTLPQSTNQNATLDVAKKKQEQEKKQQLRLEKEMKRNRKIHLKEANIAEDRIIKQLEKNLKLNKRKSKSVPKSFAADGLSYLLEMCDDENRKLAVETEKQLLAAESGSELEDDFIMITDSANKKQQELSRSNESDNDKSNSSGNSEVDENSSDEGESSCAKNMTEQQTTGNNKRKADSENAVPFMPRKKMLAKINSSNSDTEPSTGDSDPDEDEMLADVEYETDSENRNEGANEESNQLWEDIYGRTRDKLGNIVSNTTGKYVPPAVRDRLKNSDSLKDEKLIRLKKQIKGLLNRLAEHNMHSIVSQLDELYMSHSRNNMNEMLFTLMKESIVAPVLTPDRLITEHMMLIAILHANIGTEVGAHFLLSLIKEFDEMLKSSPEVENKELDNIILMISHLYNFKVYDSQLLFQVLTRLSEKFMEKEVELILHVLKTVGFVMRKDNPTMLKEFIFKLQQKAADTTENSSRVQFMLDILLAIKNNNMSKIPQYDPTHGEHLKKLMKSLVRKGNYVSQLNISLDDLLKADQRGKWWIVGSAWSGNTDIGKPIQKTDTNLTTFSQKILDLARKQRMNTDIRRNIFCVLMTAEDFLDAFEKLHHLGLKNQQDREVIYVILDCCLQEKKFNPYYAVLAQKFCDYDRKYQMTIQYTLWDKLKTLDNYTNHQLTNLARFLTHLFIEKGLALSALKVIQFGELDKPTLKLVRQIMLGILLHENTDACTQVFERISLSPQLQNFREGLRLFIRHFLLKNIKVGIIPEAEMVKLKERAEIAENTLTKHGVKTVF
ncbi:nucleolar MIF4G domain-containing protein 1 isoform X1 [Neodiprion lecontei]|uniref:Nucleolar MIF4G domain-containing protein 1 isoform X1 n=2 Tax=Neodiprion lecontei TaxID=441921 RepID=A0A6J0BAR8_NEOLC|nr:nucleolar MIF4G domain-containing protein 1 isoform X1 [Neodiprion lecontei]